MLDDKKMLLNQPKIKILVGYHKPFKLFKSDILTPIHGGRDLATKASKDGALNRLQYKWLINNTIGDNTGINQSKNNRYINEMSPIYWAWKNQKALGNPDYIGFMQYGKHLIFNPYMEIAEQEWLPESEMYSYNADYYATLGNTDDDTIIKAILDNDVLCPCKYDIRNCSPKSKNCRDRLHELSDGQGEIFDFMCKIIRKKYKKFAPYVKEIEQGPKHYPLNCFVMKTELFNEYGEFVFGVLDEILKKYKKTLPTLTTWQQRTPAFCAEFLTSIFISSLQDKKIKECKVAILSTPLMQQSINLNLKSYFKYTTKMSMHRFLSHVTFGKFSKRQKQCAKNYKNLLK